MDKDVRQYFLDMLKNKNKPLEQHVQQVEEEDEAEVARQTKREKKAKGKRLNGYYKARKK